MFIRVLRAIRVCSFRDFLDIHQPDVDVLPVAGLMAMHRQNVLARLDRLRRRLIQRAILIRSRIAGGRADQHAVQIDFGVFVVMNSQAELVQRLVARPLEVAAQPDAVRLPRRLTTDAGVEGSPNPPGPDFQAESSKPDFSQPSLGLSVEYLQVCAACSDVGSCHDARR